MSLKTFNFHAFLAIVYSKRNQQIKRFSFSKITRYFRITLNSIKQLKKLTNYRLSKFHENKNLFKTDNNFLEHLNKNNFLLEVKNDRLVGFFNNIRLTRAHRIVFIQKRVITPQLN